MSKNSKVEKTRPNEKASDRRGSTRRSSSSKSTNRAPYVDKAAQEIVTKSMNDVAWYANNPNLLVDAASISWNAPLGAPTRLMDGAVPSGSTANSNYQSFPGIMGIRFIPTPGYSDSPISPVNVAARSLFAEIRKENSGSWNYEPTDLLMYILAMDSCYSYVAWLRRIYGELMLTGQYNRYLPEAQVRSEYVDFNDLQKHIVDLRYYINQYQLKLATLVIPGNMPFLVRHMWMCSNVYLDEANMKGQMYKFVPSGFWHYNELDGPGQLQFFPLMPVSVPSGLTFDDLVAYGNTMLGKVLASEDCAGISGDILKAIPNGLFMMDALTEDYVVLPVPNEEVLDQIQNATLTGGIIASSITGLAIKQYTDVNLASYIRFEPILARDKFTAINGYSVDRLISVDSAETNPAITMVATRLTVFGDTITDESGVATSIKPTAFGSEICLDGVIWHYGWTGTQWVLKSTSLPSMVADLGDNISAVRASLNSVSLLPMFDRHPAIYHFGNVGGQVGLAYLHFDVSNYAFISREVMRRMHETALLSEFSIPAIGTYGKGY